MATEINFAVNKVRHDNHTAANSGSLAERVATYPFNSILIVNTSATITTKISFDGTNEFTLAPNTSFSMDFAKQKSYWTRAVSGTAALEVIMGAEQ